MRLHASILGAQPSSCPDQVGNTVPVEQDQELLGTYRTIGPTGASSDELTRRLSPGTPGTISARETHRPVSHPALDRRGEGWETSTRPSRSSRSGATWRSGVLKPGMDTKEVVARFESERQALAMMNHSNVAHVLRCRRHLDQGALLRDGVRARRSPITAYCETQAPSTSRTRLELFVPRVRGDPARPPQGRHPPGHQALERPGAVARRTGRCRR